MKARLHCKHEGEVIAHGELRSYKEFFFIELFHGFDPKVIANELTFRSIGEVKNWLNASGWQIAG